MTTMEGSPSPLAIAFSVVVGAVVVLLTIGGVVRMRSALLVDLTLTAMDTPLPVVAGVQESQDTLASIADAVTSYERTREQLAALAPSAATLPQTLRNFSVVLRGLPGLPDEQRSTLLHSVQLLDARVEVLASIQTPDSGIEQEIIETETTDVLIDAEQLWEDMQRVVLGSQLDAVLGQMDDIVVLLEGRAYALSDVDPVAARDTASLAHRAYTTLQDARTAGERESHADAHGALADMLIVLHEADRGGFLRQSER